MEISDVRVRLVKDANDRLKAVCSITLDNEFVVRDVKVVEGTNGLFVAMPSRKLSAPCPKCRTQNHLRAKYCGECGAKLPAARVPADSHGREKAHRDIAHPITTAFRQTMQDKVLDAYQAEYDEEDRADQVSSSLESDSGGTGGNASEYDELIADLKGSPELRGDTGPQERSGERHERRRGRGRQRREDERHPAAGDRVEEHVAPVSSVTDSVESGTTGKAESDAPAGDSDAPGDDEVHEPITEDEAVATPADDRESGLGDQAAKGEAASEPSETDDSQEDTTAFGAGIV